MGVAVVVLTGGLLTGGYVVPQPCSTIKISVIYFMLFSEIKDSLVCGDKVSCIPSIGN